MSTMTLPQPMPARAPSSQPARSAEATTPQTVQDEASKPSRFDHAMEQARDEQAPSAGQADTAPISDRSDSAPADTTPATELPLQPWLSAALAAPAPAIQPLQPQTTDLIGRAEQATAEPDHATGITSNTGGTRSVDPAPLPMQQALSAATQVRTPQPAAPQTPSPADIDSDADAHASNLLSTSPGTSSAAAPSARQQATALPQAVVPTTERPSIMPAQPQVSPTWAHTLADTSSAAHASSTTVALPGATPAQWREPLLNTLGERVQWQLQRGQEQAVIRLEPANLGRVEIHIRQEAGGLQVHITATHRDVVQQLQGVSDQLRHELSARHAGEVAVAVADQGRDPDGRQRSRGQTPEQAQTPGRALGDAGTPAQQRSAFALSGTPTEGAGA